jgi:hypothetical protein
MVPLQVAEKRKLIKRNNMKKSGYTKDVIGYNDGGKKKSTKVASGQKVTRGAGPFGKAKGVGAPRKKSY